MSCNFSHGFFVTVFIRVIVRVYVAKKITLTLLLSASFSFVAIRRKSSRGKIWRLKGKIRTITIMVVEVEIQMRDLLKMEIIIACIWTLNEKKRLSNRLENNGFFIRFRFSRQDCMIGFNNFN